MDYRNGRITVERLKEVLEYNPESGLLSSRKSSDKGKIKGSARGTDKYLRVQIDKQVFYVHRLVWLYHYGEWPPGILDHIDGNPRNNKIDNLRLSNAVLNGFNRVKSAEGVSRHGRRWRVKVGVRRIGSFATKEEALAVRKRALDDYLSRCR